VIESKRVSPGGKLYIRATVSNGKDIIFSYSSDGKKYTKVNENAVDGFFLPPWDRAVRVALISKGTSGTKGVFEEFALKNQ
jgi:xylan 1,4-beta-xylosidase